MPRHRSRKIEIYDRVTSISVEPEIWFWLRQAAVEQCSTAKAWVEAVDKARPANQSLSSALRLAVTPYLHDNPLPR
jgi:predicted DNA-binding ribbon-helix-helix protein